MVDKIKPITDLQRIIFQTCDLFHRRKHEVLLIYIYDHIYPKIIFILLVVRPEYLHIDEKYIIYLDY